MRSTIPWALAALVALAPPAAAATVQDSVATGEVDSYNVEQPLCLIPTASWEVTLTLLAPSQGDTVMLAVEPVPLGVAPVFVAIATSANPSVTIGVLQIGGCVPIIHVAGVLVAGSTPYELSWSMLA